MEKYIPDIYQKSIYTIDYEKLKERGIRCILFDLDNTLSPVGIKKATDKLKNFMKELKDKNFQVVIFSNSPGRRVQPFAEELDVDAVSFACKPYRGKFEALMRQLKLQVSEVAIIGDQLLTDIAGGNQVGITTVLVNPISTHDGILTKCNRKREERIMRKLRKRDLFMRGKYYE
ncbi:MAG: YqeG family HAD IIIA-type phosphatase [Firmicutes bacterium]|nr:YqeG family HAD IIIA-type phosphatase [Bacillota bacterium]